MTRLIPLAAGVLIGYTAALAATHLLVVFLQMLDGIGCDLTEENE